ncbi:PD-(D/E)XK nuclease-like domain-containing protein [Hymenobacter sp. BT559]|uniref:PD-(D/E)XK nuclease-like domain-containing protein n=1 Tax=Hymenobacter sp. BT559 TaxID=2795729 RepID=UPI0018ED2562|nr:PD-(D/E)XK nuclease-like domain-containing protein [Hymenobacter sp. BT559]MBJ6146397.1 PD-(D/E)XK nuclease-like domain-containing protein [Hymenobacter sp. BT559]
MFTNLTHYPSLTQEQHRALPFISNTDLSRLADELLGRPRHASNLAALAFGSYFHSATLEPHLFTPANPADAADEQTRRQAAQLAAAIRRRRYPRHVLYHGQPEQSYTATHEATGLTVKVRPDLIIDSPAGRRRTLVDFKTTSCRDLPQFLATVEQYGYDRQQAFYADVLQAHRVLLIAVQKRSLKGQPPAVWVHKLTAEQLATGRKKYQRLLRAHVEHHTLP